MTKNFALKGICKEVKWTTVFVKKNKPFLIKQITISTFKIEHWF